MKITANQLYHIYNQGNNREVIFKERVDYYKFLNIFRERVLPYCEVVNYCLMPNHYHFLINATNDSTKLMKLGSLTTNLLSNAFRLLNSSYATVFNKKYSRTGTLIRQKTKAKALEHDGDNYPFICFQYIHQNPVVARLCDNLEDWEFSSFRDYCGKRNDNLVSKQLAYELVGISKINFYSESNEFVDSNKIKGLYE